MAQLAIEGQAKLYTRRDKPWVMIRVMRLMHWWRRLVRRVHASVNGVNGRVSVFRAVRKGYAGLL